MHEHPLSFNARKALSLHLGETAGKELADLLDRISTRLDAVERDKVTVTPVVPGRPALAVNPQKRAA